MKGIILAGGNGTRLFPLTKVCSKQLLPVYDKPMIYYPLSILMLAGIREILIISSPRDIGSFENLLGDGSEYGVRFEYIVQEEPKGLPQAFTLAEDFLAGDSVTMILGDNIYYGDNFINKHILPAIESATPTIFAYNVHDPERYGVVEFDKEFNVLSLEEKPVEPKSNYAVTGLYIFDGKAPSIANSLSPSSRGELEIVDMINSYMNQKNLRVELLGRGVAWLDTGTHESLLQASTFIEVIEKRQGFKIACLEDIAFHKGYISLEQFKNLADKVKSSSYGEYLLQRIAEEEE